MLAKKKKVRWFQRDRMFEHWKALRGQYITKFGIGEFQESILMMRIKIALFKARKIMEGPHEVQLYIDVATNELNHLLSRTGKGSDFIKVKMYVERITGIPINGKEMSVIEFHRKLEIANELRDVSK